MPFINGRFYINPAYGRAVETARLAEQRQTRAEDECETGGSHWVTIDHRHVLIHESHGPRTNSAKERLERRTEVGYGETAGILPQSRGGAKGSIYDRNTWDVESARALEQARINIMDISTRNGTVRRARPGDLKNPIERSIWQENLAAAAASRGNLPGKYFFIRQGGKGTQRPPKAAGFGQGKPIREYGLFVNVGGGDVPAGNRTFIDVYQN